MEKNQNTYQFTKVTTFLQIPLRLTGAVRLAIILIFLLLLVSGIRADDVITSKLVDVQQGNTAILITAPHGGDKRIKRMKERKSGSLLSDMHTYELVEELKKELQRKHKKKPFIVRAEFHRKYIDANRAPEEAYESSQAKPHYDAYHAAIRRSINEIRKKWKDGIMCANNQIMII